MLRTLPPPKTWDEALTRALHKNVFSDTDKTEFTIRELLQDPDSVRQQLKKLPEYFKRALQRLEFRLAFVPHVVHLYRAAQSPTASDVDLANSQAMMNTFRIMVDAEKKNWQVDAKEAVKLGNVFAEVTDFVINIIQTTTEAIRQNQTQQKWVPPSSTTQQLLEYIPTAVRNPPNFTPQQQRLLRMYIEKNTNRDVPVAAILFAQAMQPPESRKVLTPKQSKADSSPPDTTKVSIPLAPSAPFESVATKTFPANSTPPSKSKVSIPLAPPVAPLAPPVAPLAPPVPVFETTVQVQPPPQPSPLKPRRKPVPRLYSAPSVLVKPPPQPPRKPRSTPKDVVPFLDRPDTQQRMRANTEQLANVQQALSTFTGQVDLPTLKGYLDVLNFHRDNIEQFAKEVGVDREYSALLRERLDFWKMHQGQKAALLKDPANLANPQFLPQITTTYTQAIAVMGSQRTPLLSHLIQGTLLNQVLHAYARDLVSYLVRTPKAQTPEAKTRILRLLQAWAVMEQARMALVYTLAATAPVVQAPAAIAPATAASIAQPAVVQAPATAAPAAGDQPAASTAAAVASLALSNARQSASKQEDAIMQHPLLQPPSSTSRSFLQSVQKFVRDTWVGLSEALQNPKQENQLLQQIVAFVDHVDDKIGERENKRAVDREIALRNMGQAQRRHRYMTHFVKQFEGLVTLGPLKEEYTATATAKATGGLSFPPLPPSTVTLHDALVTALQKPTQMGMDEVYYAYILRPLRKIQQDRPSLMSFLVYLQIVLTTELDHFRARLDQAVPQLMAQTAQRDKEVNQNIDEARKSAERQGLRFKSASGVERSQNLQSERTAKAAGVAQIEAFQAQIQTLEAQGQAEDARQVRKELEAVYESLSLGGELRVQFEYLSQFILRVLKARTRVYRALRYQQQQVEWSAGRQEDMDVVQFRPVTVTDVAPPKKGALKKPGAKKEKKTVVFGDEAELNVDSPGGTKNLRAKLDRSQLELSRRAKVPHIPQGDEGAAYDQRLADIERYEAAAISRSGLRESVL